MTLKNGVKNAGEPVTGFAKKKTVRIHIKRILHDCVAINDGEQLQSDTATNHTYIYKRVRGKRFDDYCFNASTVLIFFVDRFTFLFEKWSQKGRRAERVGAQSSGKYLPPLGKCRNANAESCWPCCKLTMRDDGQNGDDCYGSAKRIYMYVAMVNANCQLWTNSFEREIKLTPFCADPPGRNRNRNRNSHTEIQKQQHRNWAEQKSAWQSSPTAPSIRSTGDKTQTTRCANMKYLWPHIRLNCSRECGGFSNWLRPSH